VSLQKESDADYQDFAAVESRRSRPAAEEFPDGPYGSSIDSHAEDAHEESPQDDAKGPIRQA
jgi:hypothetical protein